MDAPYYGVARSKSLFSPDDIEITTEIHLPTTKKSQVVPDPRDFIRERTRTQSEPIKDDTRAQLLKEERARTFSLKDGKRVARRWKNVRALVEMLKVCY